MKRFELKHTDGRRLAYIVAETDKEAVSKLISEPGYDYYKAEDIVASEIDLPMITDAYGNSRRLTMTEYRLAVLIYG